MNEPREHGGWNRCRACKHDGPCPCSGEACCDRFLLCGHCPEVPGHIDECCILLEYPDLLAEVERLRAEREALVGDMIRAMDDMGTSSLSHHILRPYVGWESPSSR